MQTTTNYDLRKYESGDLFNPLTVNNPNLDDIDTDMKAISDRAIGRATELVSQGVHAITVLDTDCKTIKWVATANFTAGETFTINGIQCNAYLPSGEALGTNAYVSGATVIASLNSDNSAMTVYVPQGSVAVASDSERLGGELPSYYAKQSDMDTAEDNISALSSFAGNKALVNTYYDTSVNKLYVVNADGSVGGEIKMGSNRCYTFLQHTAYNNIDISDLADSDYITITAFYQAGNSRFSERVSVATAKTWTNHIVSVQTNIGLDITYSSGKLNITCQSSNNIVMATINFD